jgi:hypothetical protein
MISGYGFDNVDMTVILVRLFNTFVACNYNEPFKAYWLRDAPTRFYNILTIARFAHTVFMCFVFV